MTVTQQSPAIPVLTAMESVTYVIENAGHMELNLLDKLVTSRDEVDAALSGWRPLLGADNQVVYTVVFKSWAHAGNRKVVLRELIKERIPSLIIISS